ncbi:MAG: endolytic transglycosylase MltG [Candidatus Cloacimonetes bacterium]|nr:endolytic transglycosylase MltG [Candidatus Cloacimonadota bacterium]
MKRLLASLLVLILLALGVTTWLTMPVHIDSATFVVRHGATAAAIADSLHRAGLIRHPLPFRLWVKATGDESRLGRGTYHFEGDVSLPSLVSRLRNGNSFEPHVRLTIPEGLRLGQTVSLLVSHNLGDAQRYNDLLADTSFVSSLLPDSLFGQRLRGIHSLEGFLYPETYFMKADEPLAERGVLRRMVAQFALVADSLRLAEGFPLNGYETLVLASIIEREAMVEEEKPLIAGVFLNRLERGMALQACPTVLYALSQRGIERHKLLFEDLDIVSPFNTYRHRGLPPTPICSPSLSSIRAALQPTDSRYLYFIADGQGRHRFSTNFEEHKRQRWEVRRGS